MKIVILGCGRVGALLATMLDRGGHTVSVIDQSNAAFQRLPGEFQGSEFVGNGVDEDVLLRAGIKEADAFIAGVLNLSGKFWQHGEASTYVKPANDNWDFRSEKMFRQIDCARELICLNTDQADHARGIACHLPNN